MTNLQVSSKIRLFIWLVCLLICLFICLSPVGVSVSGITVISTVISVSGITVVSTIVSVVKSLRVSLGYGLFGRLGSNKERGVETVSVPPSVGVVGSIDNRGMDLSGDLSWNNFSGLMGNSVSSGDSMVEIGDSISIGSNNGSYKGSRVGGGEDSGISLGFTLFAAPVSVSITVSIVSTIPVISSVVSPC